MRRIASIVVALLLGGCMVGQGGGEADFRLTLPTLLPPLIVIEPGVSVVGDMDDEVFYSDGYYWARQDNGWYRSTDHRRGWARVEDRHVPAPIARSPPGRYKHYRGNEGSRGGQDKDQHEGHGH